MKLKVNEDACIGCGACQATCSEVFEIDYPMYMIDKSKRQLLYLARKDQIESVENLFDRLENSVFHKRIARTKNQFIEKIMIKDAGYDDRIIELMKVHFAKSIKKDHPDRKISEIVFTHKICIYEVIIVSYIG